MDTAAPRARIVRFGVFEADLDQRVLTKNGARVRLQDQPFQILVLLLEHVGEVVTREDLRQNIWSSDTFVAFDDGLNTAVKKLRLALGDAADNPLYIETVPRRGYRFVAPVAFRSESLDDSLLPVEAEMRHGAGPSGGNLPESFALDSGADGRNPAPRASGPHRNWWLTAAAAIMLLAGCRQFLIWHAAQSSQEIAKAAQVHLADGAAPNPANLAQATQNALQDYLQGNHYWAARTEGGLPKAVEYFQRSIAEDPSFARSWAALANCYIVYPMFPGGVSQTVGYPKAAQAAQKALALDSSLPEAHLAAAEVAFYVDWDFKTAQQEFDRTLELSPNYVTAHQWYGEFLSLMGQHAQAIHEDETAARLDPNSAIIHHQLGNTLQEARQYDRAIAEYQRSIQLSPTYALNYHAMMWAQRRQGRYADAVKSMMTAAGLYDKSVGAGMLKEVAAAYAAGGRKAFLRKEVEIASEGTRPSIYLARDYAQLGNKDMAIRWLERAFQLHDMEVFYMNNDPEFDSLRSDPRFQSLAKQIRFR